MRLRTFAAAAAALVLAAGPAAAKDKVEVVTSSFGFLYLTALTGVVMGNYEAEGLEVNVTRTGGGTKALAAVIGGDAHMYIGAPVSAIRAREKGADVASYGAAMTQYSSNLVISKEWAQKHGITEKSSYQDKLKAMKGGTFGVTSVGSGTDQVVRWLAMQAGLDPNRDVTITGLGNGETMTAAMTQGRIDGFTHSAPVAENAVKNLGAVMLFNFAQGEVKPLDGFLYITMIAKDSWVKAHPDVVVRFLKGMQKTLDDINGPKTNEARDKTWERWHNKTDKALYDYTWENTRNAFPKTIMMTEKQVRQVIDFANQFEKNKIDFNEAKSAFNTTYAEKALAELGRPVKAD